MSNKWDELNLTEQCKNLRQMERRFAQAGRVSPNMEVIEKLCRMGIKADSSDVEMLLRGSISIENVRPPAPKQPPLQTPLNTDTSISKAIELASEYNASIPPEALKRTWHHYV